jgi:hypothetical protein
MSEQSEKSEKSEKSEQDHPDGKATRRRTAAPARHFSLLGVGLLVIGAITYFAVPAMSRTWAHSADARALSARPGPNGRPTLPGPMPGAPTQKPTPPAPPPGGPRASSHRTPKALQPSNPARVRTWNSGVGGRALATVTELSGNALLAKSTQQYTVMLQDCMGLSTAVGHASLAAHIPDTAMQLEYTAALASFELAASGCLAAIQQVPDGVENTVTNVNQTLIDTVAVELSTCVSDGVAATEMLRQQH